MHQENHVKNFLTSCHKQFEYYKMLGEKTFDQLTEDQLFYQPNESSNSIAILVNHISGNMLSRWTDFLTSDGEKEWRQRDQEFEDVIKTKEEMKIQWEKGWSTLFIALDSIDESNFDTIIYIRNMGHSITEATHRQLAHYSYHIGQIVFLGKLLTDSKWMSLSIPKGNSTTYNKQKFDAPKERKHFTDEFLSPEK